METKWKLENGPSTLYPHPNSHANLSTLHPQFPSSDMPTSRRQHDAGLDAKTEMDAHFAHRIDGSSGVALFAGWVSKSGFVT